MHTVQGYTKRLPDCDQLLISCSTTSRPCALFLGPVAIGLFKNEENSYKMQITLIKVTVFEWTIEDYNVDLSNCIKLLSSNTRSYRVSRFKKHLSSRFPLRIELGQKSLVDLLPRKIAKSVNLNWRQLVCSYVTS